MDFYQTAIHPCSYLPDRYSVNILADPHAKTTNQTYSWLIDHGFRRNGQQLYRPHCPHCSACIPTRVRVNDFTPNRSQTRNLKSNQDLLLNVVLGKFTEEYFELYKHYLHTRHPDSPMDNSTQKDFEEFLLGSWSDTYFMEIRLQQKLICVAVFDEIEQGLSAVYTFYDNEYKKRGLGSFSILKLIELTLQKNLSYLYLGYWINECDKMSYKISYQPLQGYKNNKWQEITA